MAADPQPSEAPDEALADAGLAPKPKPAGKPKGGKPKPAAAKPGKPKQGPKPKSAPPKAVAPKPALGRPKASANGKPRPAADEARIQQTARLLKFASDPLRLRVIAHLHKSGPSNVGDLVKLTDMSQPAVSHHLALLRHGLIIHPTRDGKFIRYDLTDDGRKLAAGLVTIMGLG